MSELLVYRFGVVAEMALAEQRLTLGALSPSLLDAAFDAAQQVTVAKFRSVAEHEMSRQVGMLADAALAGAQLFAVALDCTVAGAECPAAVLAGTRSGARAPCIQGTLLARFSHLCGIG